MNIHKMADRLSGGAMATAVAVLLATASVADARETLQKFPLEAALAKSQASGQLATGIKLFFGAQKHPKPTAQLGPARTNKKTNFFNKTDQEACDWAFQSAMIQLTQYAQRVGGNAIVNIRSNYKNHPFSSETEYECGAGNVTGGAAFVGDVVKLP
ncbi:MAG: excinuclease ABC subunit A [Pseudomonadota bacterium]